MAKDRLKMAPVPVVFALATLCLDYLVVTFQRSMLRNAGRLRRSERQRGLIA
jgi:hypothetical protein